MGVYKEGFLLEGSVSFLPSPLPLPLLSSSPFSLTLMSSSEMNDSIFFDSGLPPPTNNGGYNFPEDLEGYSLWQKYLMSKNCESAELAQQHGEEHSRLLNNVLSSFLELQSDELLTSRVSAKHTRRVSVKVWVVGLCSSGVCVGRIQRSQQR